jgi:DNA segregation ATPase FtsK/SpoIIIE-like protein
VPKAEATLAGPSKPEVKKPGGTFSAPERKPADKPAEQPKPEEKKPGGLLGIFGRKPADKPAEQPKPEEKKPGGLLGIFGRKPADAAKPADKPAEQPKPEEKKPGGFFSPFGRKPADAAKPADKPAEQPKPEEKKPGGFFSPFGRKPADAAKPADKPAEQPKPEEKKPGGFFSAFGRKPADAAKPADKPAEQPKPEAKPDSASKPEDKPAGRPKIAILPLDKLFKRDKKAEDKPAPRVDAPKIGTGKPIEKPKAEAAASAPAAKPESAKPEQQKPEAAPKRGFWARFRGSAKPEGQASVPLKTPAPATDARRSGSSIPGAPPARGEKQARPLEGQTHVTVKNIGLSLDQKLDIVGWMLIGTGVVMIFGLIWPDEGTITKAIVDIFGALFGYGRYLIPIPCLLVGSWLLIRYFKENPFLAFDGLQMTGGVLLFLSIVTWLHTFELIDKVVYDWDELVAVSARAVDLMQGGGWVGDRLYMILIRLTGEFGVPVVLTITTVIGFMWLAELSLAEVTTYIKSFFQILAARLKRIGESWRMWRHAVKARRAARQAERAQMRAQREAAKLAAQAQAQPQTASLPAAATLAHVSELPEQPVAAPVSAEARPARKAAFRTPVVVPAVTELPATSEETPLPEPAIAKPEPLSSRSTSQTKPFEKPFGAAPTAESKPAESPAAEAKPAAPEPTAPADASPKPAERKSSTFGSIFGTKPKSEPAAEAKPAAPEPTAPADASPKPAERKSSTFGSIFGTKPKSEPAAEAKPAAPTTSTQPAAPQSFEADEAPDPETTQPTHATSIFSTPRALSKSSLFGDKPKSEPAAPSAEPGPAEDEQPTSKAPPPKPSSSFSSPFSSPSAFRSAPKPSAASPEPAGNAAQSAEDELEYVPDPEAEETLEESAATPVLMPATAPRIFGISTASKAAEPATELPPMQLPPGQTSWPMPDYRELLEAGSAQTITEEMLLDRKRIIEETLEDFGAPGRVVEINVGPTITQFGVEPGYLSARGKQTRIKVNQIAKLDADLALALAARSIRIEAPVPGKGYVGIEVPNPAIALVGLRDIIASPAFNEMRSRLRLALGKSIDGAAVVADLAQMPHLLIAGTTGSGKSVCVNALIACLLLQNSPDDLKLIMVDPKRVELTGYNGIPHLVSPVVVDLERVTGVLRWVTREMDDRYKKFAALGARNIIDYNAKIGASEPRMPYLVVIIDELADLMMLAPDETEKQLTRLAQMARATGIHLIISTQRPSVDVVTGLIKANFPARISFAVASSVDSRVILDQPGAEKLLGRGDMLYQAPDASAPIRVQGVFVSDVELRRITDFWKNAQKERGTPISTVSFDHAPDRPTAKLIKPGETSPFQSRAERFSTNKPFDTPRFTPQGSQSSREEEFLAALRDEPSKETKVDEALYQRAVELYTQIGAALNVSTLQRRLNVGYTQAQVLYKQMRERGIFKADNGQHGADS